MQSLRERRTSAPIPRNSHFCAVDCGWHFSWLGGPEAVKAKARMFTHSHMIPLLDQHAERIWHARISPVETRLLEVVIDSTWPRYMQERRGPAAWYWGVVRFTCETCPAVGTGTLAHRRRQAHRLLRRLQPRERHGPSAGFSYIRWFPMPNDIHEDILLEYVSADVIAREYRRP